MDLTMPPEVVAFAQSARQAFTGKGLGDVWREPPADSPQHSAAYDILLSLGLGDMQDAPRDLVTALAASALAEEAGRVALPVPVAALLTGKIAGLDVPVHAVSEVGGPAVLVDYARVFEGSRLVTPNGEVLATRVLPSPPTARMLAPFAARVLPQPDSPLSPDVNVWAWHELFSAFSALGALDKVLELCQSHLKERIQFGKPLKARQALEHRFVDSVVVQRGLRELCAFTAWRLVREEGPGTGAALTLRLVHLEAIESIMRNAHQIHGAIGFCFEHDLAVLSQYLQFRRYQPLSLGRTRSALGDYIDEIPTLHRPRTTEGSNHVPELVS
ncbi:acyl-CoA dehydrogenase family protein [Arthrobacter sp. W4I7]|uniref:acyl-CoA dehydrogenase family protein n=1 Tax=Arthrobacter sp. W4I7 TaxID=3042296 RepID=UPI002785EFBA|nr:acyl-CoA dehydrogenase family protein [Arthrobacter sp. W4I7]MDQ0691363.1 hypothetical protein [Arthrobacter sp. W4I7]